MRYFYDCEFIEDGRTIELVSIGIVAGDGREYYAVNGNVQWERVARSENSWLRENVWKHLPTTGVGQLSLNRYNPDVKDRWKIAQEVRTFLLGDTSDGQVPLIELWADYPAYDHVVLCQLWGRMTDLPEGIPMRTNGIVQLAEELGISEKSFPKQDPATSHHALYDAKHNKLVFDSIHPEAFRQRYFLDQGIQPPPLDGQLEVNSFSAGRRGEEGNPSISLMTTGKTYGGRAVSDLPHVFPESLGDTP